MQHTDAKSFSKFIDVRPTAGPVHERRRCPVNELVMQLDAFFGEPGFKEPQHCCQAIFAAAMRYKHLVVAPQIEVLQVEGACDRSADRVVFNYIAITHV
jgi:hypothetical protein